MRQIFNDYDVSLGFAINNRKYSYINCCLYLWGTSHYVVLMSYICDFQYKTWSTPTFLVVHLDEANLISLLYLKFFNDWISIQSTYTLTPKVPWLCIHQKRSETAISNTTTNFFWKKQFLTHLIVGSCSMMNLQHVVKISENSAL